MNKKLIIVDDDPALQIALHQFFASKGFDVRSFSDAESALSYTQNAKGADLTANGFPCDLVICDLRLPGMSGVEFAEKLTRWNPFIPVILITANGDQDNAAVAMSRGAFDYILKPINFQELSIISDRATRIANLELKFKTLKTAIDFDKTHIFGRMSAKSSSMQDIFILAKKVAASDTNILIGGESGTGKEMLAEAIHQASSRREKAFVRVNCSAIPQDMLEAELFGKKHPTTNESSECNNGLLLDAHEGTIYLQEIAELSLPLQSKLLRILQEKKIRLQGDSRHVELDIRIIASTQKDLKKLVEQGHFREDLYYRLSVIPICIPPLRERREDIYLLATVFLEKYASKNNLKIKGFSRKAMARLFQLRWNGNVRELDNTIERAVILSQGNIVDEQHIIIETTAKDEKRIYDHFSNHLSLHELEKEYIKHILSCVEDRKERAAKILGIDRKTLYRKEKQYNLQQL